MKLTKLKIDRAKYCADPGRGDRCVIWDTEVPGFGVRVYPSGMKSFVISFRVQGRKRLMTLGPYGVLTLEQARERARKRLIEVLDGRDPLAERQKISRAECVQELCKEYMAKYAIGPDPSRPHKKSYAEDQRRIDKFVLPAWKNHKVRSIQHADVLSLRYRLGQKSIYEANRTVALISTMWEFARAEGIIDRVADNPARGIEKYKETKRMRWVTPEEMPKLIRAINSDANVYVRAILWLYLLTGCRKSELLTAKWEYVDLNRRQLNLPDTKSGQSHHIPLSAAAIEILQRLPREQGNPFIFPGRIKGRHLVNISKPWDGIRAQAGVSDVRIHDLRHTVGSWLKQAGNDTYLVQQVLGHSDARTTERYMHLAQEHLRAPLEEHGKRILKLGIGPSRSTCDGTESGESEKLQ